MTTLDANLPARSAALALAALLAGACAIAFAPIFVRVSEVGPVSTAFWRVILAVPLAWAWMLAARSPRGVPSGRPSGGDAKPVAGRDLRILALCGLFFSGDLGVWHVSLKLTSVANSTLLVNMAPIFVTLGAWLVWRQQASRLFLAGMAVALAGSMLLVRDSLGVSRAHLLGDGLALVAAVSYAGYILTVKQLRGRINTATVMAWSSLFTGAALLPAVLASGEVSVPATPHGWLVLIGLALVCQIGGQSLITWAMAHLPAAFSSVSLLLQPVMAALLAWLILAEPVAALQVLGGAAVLAGIYIARRGSS